jgi:hypothetical protein
MSALASLTTPCARICSIHPQERELARHRLVLFCCDTWLPANDEVPLTYRPFVPAAEGHFHSIAERARYSLRASTCKDRAVDRDWLPTAQPCDERGHDRKVG